MYHAVIVDVLLKDGWQFTVRVETGDEETDLGSEIVGFVIRHNGKEIYEGLDCLADFGENVGRFLEPITSNKSAADLWLEDFVRRLDSSLN